MKIYRTKSKMFSGSDFHEVRKQAYLLYSKLKKKTKRRPYIRSAYFKKDKIFLDLFWRHLFDKQNWRDRMRRTKYFACAIELIQKSRHEPESKENPNKRSEILHRFTGITSDSRIFYVQIKENKRTNQKFLISTFPESK